MTRKLVVDGYKVTIEIPCQRGGYRGERTAEHAYQEAKTISMAVKRHLGPYHDDVQHPPTITQDGRYVCEYCGSKWTEESLTYNACCQADADNDPLKCVRCNGTGIIDAPFSGSDPSCPNCDGEGRINARAKGE